MKEYKTLKELNKNYRNGSGVVVKSPRGLYFKKELIERVVQSLKLYPMDFGVSHTNSKFSIQFNNFNKENEQVIRYVESQLFHGYNDKYTDER